MTADPAALRFREARLGQAESRLAVEAKTPGGRSALAAARPVPDPGFRTPGGRRRGRRRRGFRPLRDLRRPPASGQVAERRQPRSRPDHPGFLRQRDPGRRRGRVDGRKPRTLDSAEYPCRERLRLPGELGRRGKQDRALGARPGLRNPGELQAGDALPARVPAAPRARGRGSRRERPSRPSGPSSSSSIRPTGSGRDWPCAGCTGRSRPGSPKIRSSCTSARPTRRSSGRPSTSAPRSGSRWSS